MSKRKKMHYIKKAKRTDSQNSVDFITSKFYVCTHECSIKFPFRWTDLSAHCCSVVGTAPWVMPWISIHSPLRFHFPKPRNKPTPCSTMPNVVILLLLLQCSGVRLRNWVILRTCGALTKCGKNQKLQAFQFFLTHSLICSGYSTIDFTHIFFQASAYFSVPVFWVF